MESFSAVTTAARLTRLAGCILLALPLHSTAALAAGNTTPAQAAILSHALAPSPLREDLRHLTDDIGGRVSGTPAMAQAVEWAVSTFKAAGLEVHTESYDLPTSWTEESTRVELKGVRAFAVRAVSVAWAPSTPAGGIEAPLVDVGNGTEADFSRQAQHLPGAIALVHSSVLATWADLNDEYARAPGIIERSLKHKVQAILWIGARDHLVLYRHTDASFAEIAALPMAILAREDGLRLARTLAAHPGAARAHLSIANRVGGPIEQQNVIAEIRGREHPEELVILGAHLDSWELGTGALDNGCNAAMVIAAARAIRAAAAVPRRTLQFVLFSGEEQGLVGSNAYVQRHRDELDRVAAVIVFDSGSGRVTGYSLGGRDDIEAGVREVLAPLEGWDVDAHTLDASTGTDNLDFLLEGVPTLVANQEESNYMINYHAATDTFDKVDLPNVQNEVAIAALTAYGIAERAAPLGPRQTRAQIEELMQRTGLDQQLKLQGYWPGWESSTRGRRP